MKRIFQFRLDSHGNIQHSYQLQVVVGVKIALTIQVHNTPVLGLCIFLVLTKIRMNQIRST